VTRDEERVLQGNHLFASLPSFPFSTGIGVSPFIDAKHVSAIHSTLREAGRKLCLS